MTPEMGAAIVAAYSELGHVAKDATGHHGTYATIGSVLDTVKPILHKHGLAVVQMCGDSEPGFVTVTTLLVHESGEVEADAGLRMPAPNDPQKVGSAISYARRYGLMTMMGLAAADDDGQAASEQIRHEEANPPHPLSERVAAAVAEMKALDDVAKAHLKDYAKLHGYSLAGGRLLENEQALSDVEFWLAERSDPT